MKWNNYNLSITIESSLIFTLFIFIFFILISPLFIFKNLSDAILYIDDSSKKISYYTMIKNKLEKIDISKLLNFKTDTNLTGDLILNEKDDELDNNDETEKDINKKNNKFLKSIEESLFNLTNFAIIINKLLSLNFDKSNNKNNSYIYNNISWIIPNDFIIVENDICKYDFSIFFKLPFNLFNLDDVKQEIVSYRRLFVGSDGDRYNTKDKEDIDEYIYVAKNFKESKVYHTSINCTYLKKVTYSKEVVIKNDKVVIDGKKYTNCPHCSKNIPSFNLNVFYTEFGDDFHINNNCSYLNAYISKVSSSYIEEYDLHKCQKCK